MENFSPIFHSNDNLIYFLCVKNFIFISQCSYGVCNGILSAINFDNLKFRNCYSIQSFFLIAAKPNKVMQMQTICNLFHEFSSFMPDFDQINNAPIAIWSSLAKLLISLGNNRAYFIKTLATIISKIRKKVSKIMIFSVNKQTLFKNRILHEKS